MKYTPETIEKITNALINLKGRVNACKEAGISYQTFTRWMEDVEFSELIKKTEDEVRIKGKEIAIMSIFKAMPNQWQAAAWWLERNYPEEFRNRSETDITSKGEKIVIPIYGGSSTKTVSEDNGKRQNIETAEKN